ncbi:MAG: DUF4912 domain-containing protein [Solirubrobacteraceae bacterium]
MNVEPTATTSAPGGGDVLGRDDGPLPVAYGSDRLELMVRDPMWAHAYWELSIDRLKEAIESPGGRRAFLRLIGATTGHVLAEHAVRAACGSHDFALQEANSSYMVELAIRRDYRQVVLARSNVVHAPPRTPSPGMAPAFVSRAQQLSALTEGRTLELTGGGDRVWLPRVDESPQAAPTAAGRTQVGPPAAMGSEPRLRVDSEPRLAHLGSEARLIRREPLRIPFVIARSPGTPEPVAGALSALAAAVWLGREPVDVLAAGNRLVTALADAGISFGPAVAVLDPPGRDVAAPDHDARDTPAPAAAGYTATESPDGSRTVIGPDGSSITYTPVVDGPGKRSAAAVVGVRHAF